MRRVGKVMELSVAPANVRHHPYSWAVSSRGPLENETVRDLILPRLREAGWADDQIHEQYYLRSEDTPLTTGQVHSLGHGFADIVLKATPGTPVAVVEAKRSYLTADDAIQQAVTYAQQLDVPLAYGSNGADIIERNLRTGQERRLEAFAPPASAWAEYTQLHGLDAPGAALISEPFNRARQTVSGDIIEPRAYQVVAINRVLRAIAQGKKRALLLMATGTGKTFTGMQIVAKLRSYEQQTNPGRNYRVLYLADRDALIEQPIRKDFRPAFGGDAIRRVRGDTDTSRELYFATYQSLANETSDEEAKLLGYRPDFFDLVIVDECHRGSAAADSKWRVILDHFSSAIHLGLTATPRDDKDVRTYEYFGNPVYRYSLRDGIRDGYLAPYTVRRAVLSPDRDGWSPAPGELDRYRQQIPEGRYSTPDFERAVALLPRTRAAARHLSNLISNHPHPRVLVFCVDTDHAAAMRSEMIAANPAAVSGNPEWVVRIVNKERDKDRLLLDFCNPEGSTPAVATTSRLLATGIDVEDATHIVLFRPIGSMTEFKQIIGRGTRLYPAKGKTRFEIVDYVGATANFRDPNFDGDPADIIEEEVDDDGAVVRDPSTDSGAGESDTPEPRVSEPVPPFTPAPGPAPLPPSQPRRKYYVDAGVAYVASESMLVPDFSCGKLQLTEYGAFVQSKIRALGDPDSLRMRWSSADSRAQLQAALEADGVDLDELVEATGIPDIDPLDALAHLAWDLPLLTRSERAKRARHAHAADLEAASAIARDVLEALLDRYERFGVDDLASAAVFRLDPLHKLGSPTELAQAVGGADQLRAQLDLVQDWLYSA